MAKLQERRVRVAGDGARDAAGAVADRRDGRGDARRGRAGIIPYHDTPTTFDTRARIKESDGHENDPTARVQAELDTLAVLPVYTQRTGIPGVRGVGAFATRDLAVRPASAHCQPVLCGAIRVVCCRRCL